MYSNPNRRLLVILPRKELAYQLDTVLHKVEPTIKSFLAISKKEEMGRGEYPSVFIGTPKPVYAVRSAALFSIVVGSEDVHQM